jgi:hypothetical protein
MPVDELYHLSPSEVELVGGTSLIEKLDVEDKSSHPEFTVVGGIAVIGFVAVYKFPLNSTVSPIEYFIKFPFGSYFLNLPLKFILSV